MSREGRLTGYKAPGLTVKSDTETSWVRTEDGIQAAKFSVPLSEYINDVRTRTRTRSKTRTGIRTRTRTRTRTRKRQFKELYFYNNI